MNTITKIEIGKRNKERVNIYIDEEFAFSISAEIIYKEKIAVKDSIDKEKLTRLAEEDNYIKCKNSALKTIERAYKTEKEITDKLILKEFDHKTIDRVIQFLIEYNLLDDRKYARMYIKDKIKSQGENKIKYTLKRKGISDEIIDGELSIINEENVREIAFELAVKKYKALRIRDNDNYKISQKLYRFLITRGYNYDVVTEIIKRVVKAEEFI